MSQGALTATRLRCERLIEPLDVGTGRPVLSWVPEAAGRGESQTGYRIAVASDPRLLARGVPDLWDSGRVGSADVSGVTYAGQPLESRQRVWWAAQLWDRAGEPGPVSEPAMFEVALLRADDWTARWIGDTVPGTSPLLRTEFDLPGEVTRARAYVTGLGYYELRLNGEKVGDRVLDPAQTTWDEVRDLRTPNGDEVRIRSPRVVYTVYDITDRLRTGTNAVGLILGDGWYSPKADPPGPHALEWERTWGDRPRGIVQLEVEFADGSRVVVASDDSWRVAPGPIVTSNHTHGEHYDARLEEAGWDEAGFASEWAPAAELPAPGGFLTTAMLEPIRVVETIPAVSITELREGVRIVDVGQHVSGWSRIRITAPEGGRVTLRHAGEIFESGELNDRANMFNGRHPARQTDVYVSAGGSAEWEPRFTQHGFRYVEVTTTPGVVVESVEARVTHTDVAHSGSFTSSDELLNRIERNVRWTFRESIQGIPQDAADRSERVGWLGDPGWVIEDYLYQLDTVAFWAKWLDDIADTQHTDGLLPVVTPIRSAANYGGDVPDWSAAYPEIAWQLYVFSGDRTILERHYEPMRKMLDWYSGLAVDGVVTKGIGDHMEPQPDGTCLGSPRRTPVGLTSTAWWFRNAESLANAAELIGAPDAAEVRALAESIRVSFNRAFLDAEAGSYGTGSQTSLAMPLWFGLVPAEHRERVAATLLRRIVEQDGSHLETGTMGTSALEQVLVDIGGADVMYDIATQVDYPSWGDQIRQGATTVWEAWTHQPGPDDDDFEYIRFTESQSMKLFTGIVKFLYKDVAGITPTAPGWARMRVSPALTHRLTHASARHATARGDAAIAWRRTPAGLDLELTVPATTVADVRIPTTGIDDPVLAVDGVVLWANGTSRDAPDGVTQTHADGDGIRLEAGGGTYAFTVSGAARGAPE